MANAKRSGGIAATIAAVQAQSITAPAVKSHALAPAVKAQHAAIKAAVATGVAYTITAKGKFALGSCQGRDPGRWAIVQHLLCCTTAAAFYAAAPIKAVKQVGAVTSAKSEFGYAVKMGWLQLQPA